MRDRKLHRYFFLVFSYLFSYRVNRHIFTGHIVFSYEKVSMPYPISLASFLACDQSCVFSYSVFRMSINNRYPLPIRCPSQPQITLILLLDAVQSPTVMCAKANITTICTVMWVAFHLFTCHSFPPPPSILAPTAPDTSFRILLANSLLPPFLLTFTAFYCILFLAV